MGKEGERAARPHIKYIIKSVLKGHIVLFIAVIAAMVTCFFVPPDAEYAGYFDLDTLSCLFCTLAVVSALKRRRFFEWLAVKIVTAFGNMRRVTFALVFVTYFGSMVMANDMALITFLPLGWFVLSSCGKTKYTAFVFVMQNVAANLGGMLTPFGNPQNLYLYSFYAIEAAEFFTIMALPFAVAFLLIAGTCLQSALGSLVALSPLLVGTAYCQVISNVPSAVLLSRFTSDYRHLLIAVNIGGVGTPVSSLASLITLGEYRKREHGKTLRYLGLFSLINFAYLGILIGASYLNDLILA